MTAKLVQDKLVALPNCNRCKNTGVYLLQNPFNNADDKAQRLKKDSDFTTIHACTSCTSNPLSGNLSNYITDDSPMRVNTNVRK